VRPGPSKPAAVVTQRVRDLALLRRVHDRIDRDYAQPLAATGLPPCVAKKATRPVRNQEAPVDAPQLA